MLIDIIREMSEIKLYRRTGSKYIFSSLDILQDFKSLIFHIVLCTGYNMLCSRLGFKFKISKIGLSFYSIKRYFSLSIYKQQLVLLLFSLYNVNLISKRTFFRASIIYNTCDLQPIYIFVVETARKTTRVLIVRVIIWYGSIRYLGIFKGGKFVDFTIEY